MITATGLSYEAFEALHNQFKPVFDSNTPHTKDGMIVRKGNATRGRKRLVSSTTSLGLVLMWTRTRGSHVVLQMIFGLTQTAVSIYLRFGRRTLITVLNEDPVPKFVIPSEDEIRNYQSCIAEKHPALSGVWCTMDGLKLTVEQAPDTLVQGRFYNGWTHGHYISSVIVFCPDGTIVCYNAPGGMHDSSVAEAGKVYEKLVNVFDSFGGLCEKYAQEKYAGTNPKEGSAL
jgi:hypothetical protein